MTAYAAIARPRRVTRMAGNLALGALMRSVSGMFIADFLRKVWCSLPWRRSHVRTPTALTVDWRVDGSRAHHVSPICDVSQGGAFVCTTEAADVGSPLVLEVVTPTGWVQVKARVAWQGAKGMGVRFCPE